MENRLAHLSRAKPGIPSLVELQLVIEHLEVGDPFPHLPHDSREGEKSDADVEQFGHEVISLVVESL